MTNTRGVTVHFTDGHSLSFDFPQQAENQYARKILLKEIMADRMLMVEAEGALFYIPFDNIRYITTYPAPPDLPKHVIQGAVLNV